MDIDKLIEIIMEENSMNFSQYVIKNRALPDLYSGMKPIHAKILWSMFENKTFNYTKSANVSGKVMVYSPHGDCYETIVNMVQKDRHIYNLVEGQGNWGSSCSTVIKYGASRYTECKMSPLGMDCMQGISKNMVEMIDNYDSSSKMPKYLPTRFPLILCMAGSGIAVGMANNSPSFNLEDVCNATISNLRGEDMSILMPDFATKGYVLNDTEQIKNVNLLGKGSITLRARYKIEGNMIIISEIPYGVKINVEAIVDKIIERCKKGELKEITDCLDQTGINGLSIEITCKKGADMDKLMDKLYALTPLESSFSANMNVLVEGRPMVLGVHNTIKKWVLFRQRCMVEGLKFSANKLKDEIHLLHGFQKVLLDIDEAIKIIRHSDNIEAELMDYFKVDETQTTSIVNMKLKNINKAYIIKQVAEIKNMELELENLEQTIHNPTKVNDLIILDLQDVIKKFKQPRRTEVISMKVKKDIVKEDLIEDKTVTICITKEGYIKRNLKYSESQKMKDDDEILQLCQTNNKSDLLLITNQGRLFIRKTYDIEEKLPSQTGEYLPNILDLQKNEKVIYIYATNDWSENLICSFENGKISKMKLLKSKPIQNRKVAIDKIYNLESPLVSITITSKEINALLTTQSGHGLIINSQSINEVSAKNGKGVVGIKLDVKNMEDDKVIGCILDVHTNDSITLKTFKGKELNIVLSKISPNKISSYYEYITGKRAGLGNFLINTRATNDKVIEMTINKPVKKATELTITK